jgi:hypothetical protein
MESLIIVGSILGMALCLGICVHARLPRERPETWAEILKRGRGE